MTLQGIQKPIITTFIDDLKIFVFAKSGIMKQIKREWAVTFDIVDIRPLAFYVNLKITHNYKQKTIKLL